MPPPASGGGVAGTRTYVTAMPPRPRRPGWGVSPRRTRAPVVRCCAAKSRCPCVPLPIIRLRAFLADLLLAAALIVQPAAAQSSSGGYRPAADRLLHRTRALLRGSRPARTGWATAAAIPGRPAPAKAIPDQCNAVKVIEVFYTSIPGYKGPDEFVLHVIYPSGAVPARLPGPALYCAGGRLL